MDTNEKEDSDSLELHDLEGLPSPKKNEGTENTEGSFITEKLRSPKAPRTPKKSDRETERKEKRA